MTCLDVHTKPFCQHPLLIAVVVGWKSISPQICFFGPGIQQKIRICVENQLSPIIWTGVQLKEIFY